MTSGPELGPGQPERPADAEPSGVPGLPEPSGWEAHAEPVEAGVLAGDGEGSDRAPGDPVAEGGATDGQTLRPGAGTDRDWPTERLTLPAQDPAEVQPAARFPSTAEFPPAAEFPPPAEFPPVAELPPPAEFPTVAQFPQPAEFPAAGQLLPAGQFPPAEQFPSSGQFPPAGQFPSSGQFLPAGQFPSSGQFPIAHRLPLAGQTAPLSSENALFTPLASLLPPEQPAPSGRRAAVFEAAGPIATPGSVTPAGSGTPAGPRAAGPEAPAPSPAPPAPSVPAPAREPFPLPVPTLTEPEPAPEREPDDQLDATAEAARPAWHGLLVETVLPLRPWAGASAAAGWLAIDFDAYADHIRWLAGNGCRGVVPNSSLGEYQTLSPDERAAVVRTAIAAAPPGFTVMPGIAAYDAHQARAWCEQAAEAGASCVLLLPPIGYPADERAVVEHYREVARSGLAVVACNNPAETRVDLSPALLAGMYGDGLIVGVKESSGDVRRAYELIERAPGLDLLAGADDLALELSIAGAAGWMCSLGNALPDACVQLWQLTEAGRLAEVVPLYRSLHPLLRWDSRVELVQAVKLAMDLAGRFGGPCRPPRVPLGEMQRRDLHAAAGAALREGLR